MLAKFSSFVCEKTNVRNPITIFSCQAALTKVMSTCPQLILVSWLAKFSSLVCEKTNVRNPKTIFSCQAALTKVMSLSTSNFSSKKYSLKSHISKQLMDSFLVGIRICQANLTKHSPQV